MAEQLAMGAHKEVDHQHRKPLVGRIVRELIDLRSSSDIIPMFVEYHR